MTDPLLTILIPTFKRPKDLERLLLSVARDIEHRDDTVIVVADNDVARSAEETVRRMAEAHGLDIDYTVAPDPGVSNARNAGMARVRSRFVFFLDDDMSVLPGCTDTIMKTAEELGSTITFCTVQAALPEGMEPLTPWVGPLFSRECQGETRLIPGALGTGGCLLDLQGITLPSPVFDPAFNEVGGEDDAFFAAILKQGAKSGWCFEANALEHVPPHRATPRYMWRRHFAFGQTPARDAADRGLKGVPGVAKWMAVGGVQALVHGTACALLRLTGRPAYMGQWGRLAQGVGKMLWWDGLSPKLYGAQAK